MQSFTYGGSGAGNWNVRKFQVPWPSYVFMSKMHSGLCYKEDDTNDTKDTMAELKVQELLQMLVEDWKKWEVEILEERERREKEFDAERQRKRSERMRKPEETGPQMQAYMDNLVKLVEGTAVERSRGPEITVKLVPLNEKDDVEAYLVMFERIMAAHNLSEDRWLHYSSQLTGMAQLAFVVVTPSEN